MPSPGASISRRATQGVRACMNRSSHPFSVWDAVWGRGRFVFSVWVGTGLGGDGVDPFRIAAGLFAQSSVRQGPGSQSGRPLSRWQFWQFGDGVVSFRIRSPFRFDAGTSPCAASRMASLALAPIPFLSSPSPNKQPQKPHATQYGCDFQSFMLREVPTDSEPSGQRNQLRSQSKSNVA